MISEVELRGLARRWNVSLMLLDLDYSLGCFLAGISRQALACGWRFKGETCLRKCYFPDYRFSQDLDFTAESAVSEANLKTNIEAALRWVEREIGLDFSVSLVRVETIEDEYGAECFEARVYYRGVLSRTGSPQAIRLDITRAERLSFPSEMRPILHPFSDQSAIPASPMRAYSLKEILAEKIRAN